MLLWWIFLILKIISTTSLFITKALVSIDSDEGFAEGVGLVLGLFASIAINGALFYWSYMWLILQ